MPPTVLMVAEKPSIALAIAKALRPTGSEGEEKSGGDGGGPPVHMFQGTFRGLAAHLRVTAVAGHVFNLDFPDSMSDWDAVDPGELFDAPLVRRPTKAAVVTSLREAARGVDYLVLFLDCDREGEAICFEVIDVVAPLMAGSRTLGPGGGILRAKFSAVTPSDIKRALEHLQAPTKSEADAVRFRQVKASVEYSE